MKKKQRDPDLIYIIIVWASLAVIAAWIVLKAFGVINTPWWQQVLPFAGVIFGLGGFFQMFVHMKDDVKGIKGKIGRMDSDIGHLRIDVEVLKNDTSYLKQDVHHLKTDMVLVKSRL